MLTGRDQIHFTVKITNLRFKIMYNMKNILKFPRLRLAKGECIYENYYPVYQTYIKLIILDVAFLRITIE